MSDFAPKEIIPPAYQQLEVLSVEKTDTYGPQVSFKLKVVGGKHDAYTFVDYATRDEDTGQIKQATKAWSVYEACLGVGFHKKIKGLDDIVGKQFVAKVETTKTGSRNKVEFGTAGPVPAGGFGGNAEGDDEPEAPDFLHLAS
jgi:hypothetical protein